MSKASGQSKSKSAALAESPNGPRSRLWLIRIAASAFGLFLGLVIVAVVLIKMNRVIIEPRADWSLTSPIKWMLFPIYVAEPGHERSGHKYLYDPLLGWRNIPGWHASTFGEPLSINKKGLRGPETTFFKSAGKKRILVLGDSYAWGYGVADNETFSAALQDLLQKTNTSDWEVVNSGVSGWGTDQEYLFLNYEGFKYSPDIVILAFCLINDGQNCSLSIQYGLNKPLFLDHNLTLANVPVPKPDIPLPSEPMHSQTAIGDLLVKLMRQMADECLQKNCSFVVMKFGQFIFPENKSIAAQSQSLQLALKSVPNLHYLDLDERFLAENLHEAQLVNPGKESDGHWNAFGHATVARILHQFLGQKNLLGPQTP